MSVNRGATSFPVTQSKERTLASIAAAAAFCVSESLFMSVGCEIQHLSLTPISFRAFFSKLFWDITSTLLTKEAKFTPGNLSQVWIYFFFFNA